LGEIDEDDIRRLFEDNMKIAFPSDDGTTISDHFGRAVKYVVVDPEADSGWKTLDKAHHGSGHGQHAGGGSLHQAMFAPLADCQVLVTRGMGQPAYDEAVALGLNVILTDEESIQAALDAYAQGSLKSDPRRVHAHGGHGGHEHA
jgi:predicted Fe-Mo cluster-binding NifX family protein